MDERVARAVVNLDDPELVLDLRRMNGKAQSSLFDAFWGELQAHLDEINLAVDERRHDQGCLVAFWTLVKLLTMLIIMLSSRSFLGGTCRQL